MSESVKNEHQEQVTFFQKARTLFRESGEQYKRSLLFAIPNGGKRDQRTASSLKMEGVLSGVPDIFFAFPTRSAYGLFIEMKRRKGGRVDPEQKKIMKALRLLTP